MQIWDPIQMMNCHFQPLHTHMQTFVKSVALCFACRSIFAFLLKSTCSWCFRLCRSLSRQDIVCLREIFSSLRAARHSENSEFSFSKRSIREGVNEVESYGTQDQILQYKINMLRLLKQLSERPAHTKDKCST